MLLASASGSCGAIGAATLKIASNGDSIWRVVSYVMYILVGVPRSQEHVIKGLFTSACLLALQLASVRAATCCRPT